MPKVFLLLVVFFSSYFFENMNKIDHEQTTTTTHGETGETEREGVGKKFTEILKQKRDLKTYHLLFVEWLRWICFVTCLHVVYESTVKG